MKFFIKNSKVTVLFISVLVVVLVGSVFLIARQYTKANNDYLCTQVVTTGGSCIIPPEEYSKPFTLVPGSTTQTERTLNGTQETQITKSYSTLRTHCMDGYTEQVDGSGGGASTGNNFKNQKVVVSYASCSVKEYGVIHAGGRGCTSPKQLDVNGDCVLPQATDYCYNRDGIQSKEDITNNNWTYDIVTNNCYDPTVDVDVCTNTSDNPSLFTGVQPTPPSGYYTTAGRCFPSIMKPETMKTLDFQCSSNNGVSWNDCSRIVLPSRKQPIYLRALDTTGNSLRGGETWTIDGNDKEPLAAGKSIGYFITKGIVESKSSEPVMSLSFGTGNSFIKPVHVSYNGVTADGLPVIGTKDKTLKIIIASQDVIIEK